MLTGIALILLSGMFLGFLARKIKLPALVGMILAGILLGPSVLNILDPSLLEISPVLRKIALVIILTRAGLSLDIKELKKAGRPSLLMCFVPAALEIGGTTLIAPLLFNISHLEAAVIGSILAAVSPAVVVPRMIGLINEKRGTDKQIPQIILAGASADDVFAIVMFTSLTGVLSGGNLAATDFIQIPTSILLGILCGVLSGVLLAFFFTKVHIRDTAKVIILMSVSFLLT
ncbi:MAG: cation:proton antiporter, partial [Ruminiclostridium sp.]